MTYPGFDLPSEINPPTDPVTPAANAPAPPPVPAVGGGFSPEDQTKLTKAVDFAVAARRQRTGWARPAIVAEVSAALDAGHPVDVVVSTLAEIAKDLDGTDYPARLVPYLGAKAKRAAAAGQLPEPYRHKPAAPCQPGCDCWKHTPPAGAGPGISEETAAIIAARRAALPPGKPLWRRGGLRGTGPSTNPGTAASGDVAAPAAPESVNA